MSPRLPQARHGRDTEQLIGAILPDAAGPATASPAPLPVLPAPPRPRAADSTAPMIGTARVDRSGRFHDRRILHALRWRPADDLVVDLVHALPGDAAALVVAPACADSQAGPDSPAERALGRQPQRRAARCQVDARGAITLPAAARGLCHIAVGSRVVLVAEPAANRLLVYPAALVIGLLVAHRPDRAHITATADRDDREEDRDER